MSAVHIEIDKEAKNPKNTLVRAFVALDFDESSIKFLEALVTDLRSSDLPHVLRWTLSHQFHITLKFLGNIDEFLIRQITEKIQTWSPSSITFRLSLASLIAFPSTQAANFIVATINDPESQLEKLIHQIDTVFSKFGVATATRRFLPHVTLATTQLPFDARNWLALNALPSSMHELTCPTLTLYRSDLTSNGTVYTSIIRHRLKASNNSYETGDALDFKHQAKQWYLDRQTDIENAPETMNQVNVDYKRLKSHI